MTEPTTAAMSPRIHVLERHHRSEVARILCATDVFRDDEVDVALEVLDGFFEKPGQDYTALGAFTLDGDLLGYVCYGPTPCTAGTHDLYWIAVDPAAHGSGVGTSLILEVERRLALSAARLVIIETSSLPRYEATRRFYRRRGYDEVARVPDFYATGDDRVIFAKQLTAQRNSERE